MFGPAGLAAILAHAVAGVPGGALSLTLEVHQAEGRLPLTGGARPIFRHWADPTNAERFNYWLSVVADNHVLATSALSIIAGGAPEQLPWPEAASTV
jgi:hypothetical protein